MAKKKHTVYIPAHIFEEIEMYGQRLDRSINWMIAHAWQLSKPTIAGYAPMDDQSIGERADAVH